MDGGIDVAVVAYGTGEYLSRLISDLPEMTKRPCELHVWYNKGVQRNLAMAKNDLAKRGTGDYILVANGDILVSPGWDEKLTGFLEGHPEVGAALPLPVGDPERKHLWEPDFPDLSVSPIPTREDMRAMAERLSEQKGYYEIGIRDEDRFCPFFAVLMRRSTFLEMQGFDERFRFFGSDRDFVRRLSRKGRITALVRSCPFWHAKAASIPEATANREFDVQAEWNHRKEVSERIESGSFLLWDDLGREEREEIRTKRRYTHLARP